MKNRILFYFHLFYMCLLALPTMLSAEQELSVLLQKIKDYQSPQSWAYKAIHSDLKAFSARDFSVFRLKRAFNQGLSKPGNQISLVSIKNNIPKIQNSDWTGREHILLNSLNYLCRCIKMPDVMFLVSSHDSYETDRVPILAFSKKKGDLCILMPDCDALSGYEPLRKSIQEGAKLSPWHKKISYAFWRGSTTGGIFIGEDYFQYPRSLVVKYSLMHPELLDARYSNVVQNSRELYESLQESGMIGDNVSPDSSLKYKYLIDVDGNASTYSRSFWILQSNSVLCKVSSQFIQWYYSLLEENHNYIKVSSDLSDLETKLNWLKNNDAAASQIAYNATIMAEEDLSDEAIHAYLFCLIDAIASIQKKR